MIIFKNIFSFGLTFSAYDWIISTNFKNVMIPIASIQVAICLLSVPLCEWSQNPSSDSASLIRIILKTSTANESGRSIIAMIY
jgi:hypothetical protein